jgi:hypothetical protein
MIQLLTEAFEKAKDLPENIQELLAQQLIEDIENELKWQNTLAQPLSSKLENLAAKALLDSASGKTKIMGFDEL